MPDKGVGIVRSALCFHPYRSQAPLSGQMQGSDPGPGSHPGKLSARQETEPLVWVAVRQTEDPRQLKSAFLLRQHVDDSDLRCSSRQQRTQSPLEFHRNSRSRTVASVLDDLDERAASFSPEFNSPKTHMVRTRLVLRELAQQEELTARVLAAVRVRLANAEARPHPSFVKDLAPLAGRGVVAGLRLSF